MEFAVTLLQTPCLEGDRKHNFDGTMKMLDEVSVEQDVHLILLPELFSIGFRHSDYNLHGPGIPGPTSDFLCEIAEEHSCYAVSTGIEKCDDRYCNTLVFTTPKGKVLGTYRKMHPFQEERDVFKSGESIALFDLKRLKVGVEVCYDLRFPEISRKLAMEGAEIILIPAAWPDPRNAHWNALISARAIENQLFVAAANRVGPAFDNKTYFGHSQVVDPGGLRLTRINSEIRMITQVLDSVMIEEVRKQITCYADRASEGYDSVEWFEE